MHTCVVLIFRTAQYAYSTLILYVTFVFSSLLVKILLYIAPVGLYTLAIGGFYGVCI